MKRFWLITNPGSGSAQQLLPEALTRMLIACGVEAAGHTPFPDQPFPDAATLMEAKVDTVVLFAGDGTVNAALCALDGWPGAFLILPGGTMNMLAKQLHESVDTAAIVTAACAATTLTALPIARAAEHRAFVGVIIGPAAHWGRARELTRSRAVSRLWRAIRFAWRRTFGRGIKVGGVIGLQGRYQAIMVRPLPGELSVCGIDARDLGQIVELGWTWLTGEWLLAGAVTPSRSARLEILGSKPVQALFDGEARLLAPGTEINPALTRPMFLATRRAA